MSDNPADRLRQVFEPHRDLTAPEQEVLTELAGIGVDAAAVQGRLMARLPNTPVGEGMFEAVRDGSQDFPAIPSEVGRKPYVDPKNETPITFRCFDARPGACPLLLVSQPFTTWHVSAAGQLESGKLTRYAAIALPQQGEAGAIRSVTWGHEALPPQTVAVNGPLGDADLVAEAAYKLPAAASEQGRALLAAIRGEQPSQVETVDDGRIVGLLNLAFAAHPEAMVISGQANAPSCVALVTARFRALGMDREVDAVLRLSQAVIDAATAAGRPTEIDQCVFDALRSQFSPLARYGAVALEHGTLQMQSGPDIDDPTHMHLNYKFTYTDAGGQQYALPPYSISVDRLNANRYSAQ